MDTLDGERGQRLVRSKKGMGKGMKQGCEFSSGKNFLSKIYVKLILKIKILQFDSLFVSINLLLFLVFIYLLLRT